MITLLNILYRAVKLSHKTLC